MTCAGVAASYMFPSEVPCYESPMQCPVLTPAIALHISYGLCGTERGYVSSVRYGVPGTEIGHGARRRRRRRLRKG
eukprot:3847160-Rhodomonas_salina.1